MIYYGFLLFILLEYVRPGSFIPGLDLLRLNSVVPLAIIAASFLSNRGASLGEVLREKNTRGIFFLVVMIGFSVLLADVTLYAWTVFWTVFGYVLIYLVICRQITTVAQIKGAFAMLIAVHVILAAMTPQMFTDPDARHYMSSGSFLGDGNDYALSVNVALPFCLFLLLDAKSKVAKSLFFGSLLLLVFCVVATKSRGGTLALGAMGFYYWLKSDRKMVMSAVAAVALLIVVLSAPQSYWERMGTIGNHEDGSSQGRLTAWRAGVAMALDHPIFGVGAGHFPVKFGVEYKPKDEQMPWLTAHSIFFLILGELGFPGLVTLLFIFTSNFRSNRRLMQKLAGRDSPESVQAGRLLAALSASLLAYAVAGAFLSAVYYPHMFMICGLMVAGRRVAQTALQSTAAAAPASASRSITYHPALRPVLGAAAITPRQIANS